MLAQISTHYIQFNGALHVAVGHAVSRSDRLISVECSVFSPINDSTHELQHWCQREILVYEVNIT